VSDELPATLTPALESRFPCKLRVVIGLQAAPGLGLDELTPALARWHRTMALEWRERGFATATGVRIAGTESTLQDSIGAMVGEAITPLDAFATIDVEDYEPTAAQIEQLLQPVDDLAAALDGVVDPERSFAMAGLVNLVLAAEGPVALMLMGTHRAGVEVVDTHAWWCSFGEVMRSAPSTHTLGYHQVQCDPGLSDDAAGRAGLVPTSFDIGDLVYLTDVGSFVAATRAAADYGDPGPPVNQRDDFISFEGSVGAFCAMLAP
jgi:hypothetical protein